MCCWYKGNAEFERGRWDGVGGHQRWGDWGIRVMWLGTNGWLVNIRHLLHCQTCHHSKASISSDRLVLPFLCAAGRIKLVHRSVTVCMDVCFSLRIISGVHLKHRNAARRHHRVFPVGCISVWPGLYMCGCRDKQNSNNIRMLYHRAVTL